MAGTTPDYGFPYMTGGDAAATIDTGFLNLASDLEDFIGSPGAGKLFHLAGTDDTSTAQTTTSSAFVNKSDCQVTFTTGPSGVFVVILSAACSNSTTGITRASLDLSGAVSLGGGGNPNIVVQGTERKGASIVKVFSGLGSTSCTVTLCMSSSAGTGTVHDATIQVVNLG